MEIKKISKMKISDIVVEQMEKLISSGEFQPGDKLPSVRELCELFDVGRSAVRDAITTLKGRGIVYVKQGEGTFVSPFDSARLFLSNGLLPNEKDIIQLFEVRKLLEAGMAEMAALNRNDADLKEMEWALNSFANHDINTWEADYAFHMAIAAATGNTILTQLMEFISSTTKKALIDFHQSIFNNDGLTKEIHHQHVNVFAMIKEGNRNLARLKMLEHLEFVAHHLQNKHHESR